MFLEFSLIFSEFITIYLKHLYSNLVNWHYSYQIWKYAMSCTKVQELPKVTQKPNTWYYFKPKGLDWNNTKAKYISAGTNAEWGCEACSHKAGNATASTAWQGSGAASSNSVFKQYTLLNRVTEAEAQLTSTGDDMIINEPAKPVAGLSKHPNVVDGKLIY